MWTRQANLWGAYCSKVRKLFSPCPVRAHNSAQARAATKWLFFRPMLQTRYTRGRLFWVF